METKEKVTMPALREMEIGETRRFNLPNAEACNSGKSTAYQAQHLLRCKFRMKTDYSTNTLTVTKL